MLGHGHSCGLLIGLLLRQLRRRGALPNGRSPRSADPGAKNRERRFLIATRTGLHVDNVQRGLRVHYGDTSQEELATELLGFGERLGP